MCCSLVLPCVLARCKGSLLPYISRASILLCCATSVVWGMSVAVVHIEHSNSVTQNSCRTNAVFSRQTDSDRVYARASSWFVCTCRFACHRWCVDAVPYSSSRANRRGTRTSIDRQFAAPKNLASIKFTYARRTIAGSSRFFLVRYFACRRNRGGDITPDTSFFSKVN